MHVMITVVINQLCIQLTVAQEFEFEHVFLAYNYA